MDPRNKSIDGCSVPSALQATFTNQLFIKNPTDASTNPLAQGFYSACAKHDICYQTCRSVRGNCDGDLASNLSPICEQYANAFVDSTVLYPLTGIPGRQVNLGQVCLIEAGKVNAGLAAGGYGSWSTRQQEVCVCCPK